jgi:hypothetical protein
VGNKITKTTRIFNDIDHPKSWGLLIGPLVEHISQVSCCAAFGAIQKNHMLFFKYFKIGCMYLDNFLKSERYKWGYVNYHFLYNYCILCNKKAEKKPSPVGSECSDFGKIK